MRRVIRVVLALITLAITIFWSYRVRAADESAQFAPAAIRHILLPAATAIPAVITNGIASSAGEGETITALVPAPVFSQGSLAIPPGAQIQGILEDVSRSGSTVKAHIRFVVLVMGSRSLAIQTAPVAVLAPARSDTQLLTAVLKTLLGAAVGAGIGATSRDDRLVERGLFEGAMAGLTVDSAVPITVSLTADLEI